jgi:hypothetical protein
VNGTVELIDLESRIYNATTGKLNELYPSVSAYAAFNVIVSVVPTTVYEFVVAFTNEFVI